MKKLLLLTLSGTLLLGAGQMAQAHGVYFQSSDNTYLRDGSGNCIRTSGWKPGTQVEGCDEIKPEPPGDSDMDGVIDPKDECPNTPRGARVKPNGCEYDSDGDGVVDSRDRCANTPRGAKVDATGCIIELLEPITYNLRVEFANNSDQIQAQYQDDFQQAAELLASDPGVTVVIEGHTDSNGSADYNQDLSQRRAENVARALIASFGIDPRRLTAVGFGESRPIADNSTADGRQRNRRVEARVQVMVKKPAQ